RAACWTSRPPPARPPPLSWSGPTGRLRRGGPDMASAGVGETILFIGAMVAAAAVAGALGVATTHFANGLQDRSRLLADQMASNIAVVNDPQHVPTSPLLLYVKNTGTRTLDAGHFAVLVDGVAAGGVTVTVGGV